MHSMRATYLLALILSIALAKSKAYDMDCAIMLCMAGGFPPSTVCAAAYREMIRRITLGQVDHRLGFALSRRYRFLWVGPVVRWIWISRSLILHGCGGHECCGGMAVIVLVEMGHNGVGLCVPATVKTGHVSISVVCTDPIRHGLQYFPPRTTNPF